MTWLFPREVVSRDDRLPEVGCWGIGFAGTGLSAGGRDAITSFAGVAWSLSATGLAASASTSKGLLFTGLPAWLLSGAASLPSLLVADSALCTEFVTGSGAFLCVVEPSLYVLKGGDISDVGGADAVDPDINIVIL